MPVLMPVHKKAQYLYQLPNHLKVLTVLAPLPVMRSMVIVTKLQLIQLAVLFIMMVRIVILITVVPEVMVVLHQQHRL